MKTNSKIMILAALAGFLASSCGNENNTPDPSQEQGITFSFEEQNYETDQDLTRSVPRTETINLGDCEAEVNVENDPDTTVNKTRAITNKHYTIRAYQGSVKKGEIKGTFNGTKFTADSNSPQDLILEQGQTYDFVAFNDDVTPSGNDLVVVDTKIQTARIGTLTTTITEQKKQQINFEMKHVCARLRTRFVCQKHIPGNITATLESTAPNVIPADVTYNIVAKTYTVNSFGTLPATPCNSPASTEPKYSASNYGQNYSYTSSSDYHYFFPSTSGSNLKLSFNAGTVFWKPITGSIAKLNSTLSTQPNKSYVVKIKLKPKFRYLFSDGKTGFFNETIAGGGTKTPIGIVVTSGLAMALHNANNNNICAWGPMTFRANTQSSNHSVPNNDSGYNLTWNAAFSSDYVTVKATSTQFPAFYYAAHYNPGVHVTGSNIGRWFLPAGIEIGALALNLYWSNYDYANYGGEVLGYGYLLEQAIEQVSGTPFIRDPSQSSYWVSTEGWNKEGNPPYTQDETGFANFRHFNYNRVYFSYTRKDNQIYVRPFVNF